MSVAIYNITILQGATFDELSFVLPGDYTDWAPTGQIRTDYASRGGQLKGAFGFAPLVIGDVTLSDNTVVNGTIIKPLLTAIQTQNMPLPTKDENWVYDIEMHNTNGKVIRIVQGKVDVSAEVTVA